MQDSLSVRGYRLPAGFQPAWGTLRHFTPFHLDPSLSCLFVSLSLLLFFSGLRLRGRSPPPCLGTAPQKSTISNPLFYRKYPHRTLNVGKPIRVLQELLRHADVKTTEIYPQVMQHDISQVTSPLESVDSL